jgi:UDP-N-acetylglucosamine 2-epimerase (non-hydrolysing)
MTTIRSKIFNIVGARPNMMKMAPIIAEMRCHPELQPVLIHTGQHYDFKMSQVFLDQLNMGEPDHNLQVGSGSHHWQTAEIMRIFGDLVQTERPDLIVVAGDVNSTIACALVGAKELIPVVHVEAGLRSFDRTMPEEINRVLTDAISDLLFTTEEAARTNLLAEGIAEEKIAFVGNVMIDSLIRALGRARQSPILDQLGLAHKEYVVLTLHRPSNVDNKDRFLETLNAIANIARKIPVIFPVHPRTVSRVKDFHIEGAQNWDGASPIGSSGIWMVPPASYFEFLCLMDSATMVITDSGGIQEETTYLGVPCITYRENTERPITVQAGTNRLIGTNPQKLVVEAVKVMNEGKRSGQPPPPLWDGRAAERIVARIREFLSHRT